MISENNHIGQSFDSFLEEENIQISEEEIKKNSLIYGFTCLDDKGKIIPNYRVFQINNELIINGSEDKK